MSAMSVGRSPSPRKTRRPKAKARARRARAASRARSSACTRRAERSTPRPSVSRSRTGRGSGSPLPGLRRTAAAFAGRLDGTVPGSASRRRTAAWPSRATRDGLPATGRRGVRSPPASLVSRTDALGVTSASGTRRLGQRADLPGLAVLAPDPVGQRGARHGPAVREREERGVEGGVADLAARERAGGGDGGELVFADVVALGQVALPDVLPRGRGGR